MAEVVGLAASIIQIAGAGASLSKALYSYVGSAACADQQISDIAGDVEITSNALNNVGEVFKNESSLSIVSKTAIQDATSLIKRCESVFGAIQNVIDKRRKPAKDGKKSLSVLGKLAWPLKEQKIQVLQSRLESLKNSLVLLFHVIQLANGQARGFVDNALVLRFKLIRIQAIGKGCPGERTGEYSSALSASTRLAPGASVPGKQARHVFVGRCGNFARC